MQAKVDRSKVLWQEKITIISSKIIHIRGRLTLFTIERLIKSHKYSSGLTSFFQIVTQQRTGIYLPQITGFFTGFHKERNCKPWQHVIRIKYTSKNLCQIFHHKIPANVFCPKITLNWYKLLRYDVKQIYAFCKKTLDWPIKTIFLNAVRV